MRPTGDSRQIEGCVWESWNEILRVVLGVGTRTCSQMRLGGKGNLRWTGSCVGYESRGLAAVAAFDSPESTWHLSLKLQGVEAHVEVRRSCRVGSKEPALSDLGDCCLYDPKKKQKRTATERRRRDYRSSWEVIMTLAE